MVWEDDWELWCGHGVEVGLRVWDLSQSNVAVVDVIGIVIWIYSERC